MRRHAAGGGLSHAPPAPVGGVGHIGSSRQQKWRREKQDAGRGDRRERTGQRGQDAPGRDEGGLGESAADAPRGEDPRGVIGGVRRRRSVALTGLKTPMQTITRLSTTITVSSPVTPVGRARGPVEKRRRNQPETVITRCRP